MCKIYKIKSNYINKSEHHLNNIYFCSNCLKHMEKSIFNHLIKLIKLIKLTNTTNFTSDNQPKYIQILDVKKSMFQTQLKQLHPKPLFDKCYLCQLSISNIINYPNLTKFMDEYFKNQPKSDSLNVKTSYDDLLLKLNKHSVWYYQGIYDNINSDIKKRYKLTDSVVKNINSSINNIIGLPAKNTINERALEIYQLIIN